MTQDHTAFPNITRLISDAVHYNGGTAARNFRGEDPVAYVNDRLDEALGADGLYYDDLKRLDDWLGALSEDDFNTVADGEETEVGEILANAPSLGDPEDTAREFIDSLYEACI